MSRNYLIGIGGTGARVAEAVAHCCAAGYGPDELTMFLIDPDEANGNLSRTKELVHNYVTARKRIQEGTRQRIFRTEIKTPDPIVWGVFPQQNETLSNYIGYEPLKHQHQDMAQFIQLLFSSDELGAQLNEGFRGHPSIGAVVMSNPDMQQEPWRTLWNDVTNQQKLESVRVFLVGSIFGGTGAAGVPTFGARQMIKFREGANLSEAQGESKILLGGALVLPYFAFDVDPVAKEREGDRMFVTPADFPIATKAALQYYSEKDLSFDELYLMGDSLNQKIGQFSPGSRGQQNRPHYIELVSALAAFDFYEQADKGTKRGRVWLHAAREMANVSWRALPVSRDSDLVLPHQSLLKERIATMTAFNYALLTYGAGALGTKHEDIKDSWYKDHFKFNRKRPEEALRDPRQAQNREVVDLVASFGRSFLDWICSLDEEENCVRLVDRNVLYAAASEGEFIRLADPKLHPGAIGSFLKDEPGGGTFPQYFNDLNTTLLEDPHAPACDRFLRIFYDAAASFCRRNYRFTGTNGR